MLAAAALNRSKSSAGGFKRDGGGGRQAGVEARAVEGRDGKARERGYAEDQVETLDADGDDNRVTGLCRNSRLSISETRYGRLLTRIPSVLVCRRRLLQTGSRDASRPAGHQLRSSLGCDNPQRPSSSRSEHLALDVRLNLGRQDAPVGGPVLAQQLRQFDDESAVVLQGSTSDPTCT